MKYPLIIPEAILCKDFCMSMGKGIESVCFVQSNYLIKVTPAIWEISISNNIYSCHIYGFSYFFKKNYKTKWDIESRIPKTFHNLIEKAEEYESLQYPKILTIEI